PDRAAAEADYLRRVDIYIGGVRAQVITAVPGQAETYQAKAADADAFLAAADPDPTDFPWVAAEARATGVTPQQAATAIVAQRDAWAVLGAAVEEVRMRAKTEIRAATSARAMQAAYEAMQAAVTDLLPDL